jgi:hypothetical protein
VKRKRGGIFAFLLPEKSGANTTVSKGHKFERNGHIPLLRRLAPNIKAARHFPPKISKSGSPFVELNVPSSQIRILNLGHHQSEQFIHNYFIFPQFLIGISLPSRHFHQTLINSTMFGNHFGCPNLWQISPLFLFSITNFCLLLCLIESPQRADATIQVLSAEQANKMAKKMVDGAMEMMRQKYRLERGWRAENAAGNGSEWAATEEEKMAAEEKRQRRRKKHQNHHHHHHHHSHHPEEQDDEAAVVVPGADGGADSSNGVPATALKYGNEEVVSIKIITLKTP